MKIRIQDKGLLFTFDSGYSIFLDKDVITHIDVWNLKTEIKLHTDSFSSFIFFDCIINGNTIINLESCGYKILDNRN